MLLSTIRPSENTLNFKAAARFIAYLKLPPATFKTDVPNITLTNKY